MEYNNDFFMPYWQKTFNNILCGFSLPKHGNQALTRKSITLKTTTKQNRILLAKKLNLNSLRIFSPHQIHTDKIIFVDKKKIGKGAYSVKNALESDACITRIKNVLLVVTWADCVPVLIYNPREKIIGAVHSGWKGTLLNIVNKVIIKMIGKEKNAENIYASIGPAIRDCCYKVGEEFIPLFSKINLNKYLFKKKDGIYFDLAGSVFQQLIDSGLNKNNIDFSGLCTCCNKEPSFFSYRKDNDKFEGQAAFICLLNT